MVSERQEWKMSSFLLKKTILQFLSCEKQNYIKIILDELYHCTVTPNIARTSCFGLCVTVAHIQWFAFVLSII